MTQRPEQAETLLRRSLQTLLARGVGDPRVRGLVSITRIALDPDFGEARVMISVLPEKHASLTLKGLQSAAPHFQRRLRDGLPLRRTPKLIFAIDDSLKQAAALEATLRAELPPDPPELDDSVDVT